jgi:hypothetical protein
MKCICGQDLEYDTQEKLALIHCPYCNCEYLMVDGGAELIHKGASVKDAPVKSIFEIQKQYTEDVNDHAVELVLSHLSVPLLIMAWEAGAEGGGYVNSAILAELRRRFEEGNIQLSRKVWDVLIDKFAYEA